MRKSTRAWWPGRSWSRSAKNRTWSSTSSRGAPRNGINIERLQPTISSQVFFRFDLVVGSIFLLLIRLSFSPNLNVGVLQEWLLCMNYSHSRDSIEKTWLDESLTLNFTSVFSTFQSWGWLNNSGCFKWSGTMKNCVFEIFAQRKPFWLAF